MLARPPSTIPHYLHSTFSSAPSNILCTAPHQPPPATTSHHTSDHKQWSVFVSVSFLQPPYSLFIDYTFPHNTFYPHLMKGIISREVNNCKYNCWNLHIQLGQPSVIPPRLVLEVGGTSALQAAVPGELKSPPTWNLEVGWTSTLQAQLPARLKSPPLQAQVWGGSRWADLAVLQHPGDFTLQLYTLQEC